MTIISAIIFRIRSSYMNYNNTCSFHYIFYLLKRKSTYLNLPEVRKQLVQYSISKQNTTKYLACVVFMSQATGHFIDLISSDVFSRKVVM
jgi:hypothetical protein